MSAKDRYEAATGYVRRAIASVESHSLTDLIEWYAAPKKTETARRELERIESRWLRARTDDERANVARDAELLADRVQESLPGAPQDRARTNLAKDEPTRSTPATSYGDELSREATAAWNHAKDAGQGALSVGRLLLVGGALVVGWRALGFLEQRARRVEASLNRELTRVANRRP